MLNEESFESLGTIVNVALIECDRGNDFYSAYLLSKLSEHYYIKDDQKDNIYLISKIRDNNLWKKNDYWRFVFAFKCEKALVNNMSKATNKEDDIVNIISDIIHLMCTLHMEGSLLDSMVVYLGKISEIGAQDADMLKKMAKKLLKNIMMYDEGETLF